MNDKLKTWLKWLWPTPLGVFEEGLGRVLSKVARGRKELQSLTADVQAGQARYGVELQETHRLLRELKVRANALDRAVAETHWAQVFNSTISGSGWLKDPSFSPGRWALGYPGLYLLYRILNGIRPRRILELGLGESTKMTAQYAASREGGCHLVLEHDPQWVDFFSRSGKMFSPRTEVVQMDLVQRPFREDAAVVAYDRFAETLAGRQFDFILIDGPFGGEAKTYARIDVVDLLPEILADSFVLVLDDYNRTGEQNAAVLIRAKLQERNVPFCEAIYSGIKDVWLICSADLGFLRSL